MINTPEKDKEHVVDTSFNQTLTPVRFNDSPRLKSPAHDSNYAACKARLDTLLKTLQDNYDKWQLAQKRGVSLCTGIEAIKTRCLQQNESKNTLYPKELQQYTAKLAIITTIFEDITKNAHETLRQLKALSKLPGSCNEYFYRSWRLEQFVGFVEELLERYVLETQIKNHVMQELPHCMTRNALITCCTAWQYPQYVDSFIALKFLLLSEELKAI